MRVPDFLAPSERRLAALLFGLALLGSLLGVGERLSPQVDRWLDGAVSPPAPDSLAAPPALAVPPAPLAEAGARVDPRTGVEPAPVPPPPGAEVDPNRAGAEALVGLPGVGPVLARRIVEERERSGPFRRPEDLLRVKGIGPATLARIRSHLRFEPGAPAPASAGGD